MNIKKIIIIIIFLSFVLQSCSVVLPVGYRMATKSKRYTHSDVMNSYYTKKNVIRGFGIPNLKDKMEGVEIWYYDKGATSTYLSYVSGKSNTYLNSNYYSGINVETRANASGVATRSSYNKYIEFQFEGDNVINWRSNGVDYGTSNRGFVVMATLGVMIDLLILLFLSAEEGLFFLSLVSR